MGYPKLTEDSFERLHLEFERTRNPLIVWRAYRMARGFRQGAADVPLAVPEWILKAFDEIAGGLLRIGGSASTSDCDWQSSVVRSLGFQASPRGGPSNPFQADARSRDWYQFAVHMRVLIDGDGQQETYAAEQVAEQRGVSATTVRRAWKEYAAVVRNEDLEQQYSKVVGDRLFLELFGSRGLSYYGKFEVTPEVAESCLKLLGFRNRSS